MEHLQIIYSSYESAPWVLGSVPEQLISDVAVMKLFQSKCYIVVINWLGTVGNCSGAASKCCGTYLRIALHRLET